MNPPCGPANFNCQKTNAPPIRPTRAPSCSQASTAVGAQTSALCQQMRQRSLRRPSRHRGIAGHVKVSHPVRPIGLRSRITYQIPLCAGTPSSGLSAHALERLDHARQVELPSRRVTRRSLVPQNARTLYPRCRCSAPTLSLRKHRHEHDVNLKSKRLSDSFAFPACVTRSKRTRCRRKARSSSSVNDCPHFQDEPDRPQSGLIERRYERSGA